MLDNSFIMVRKLSVICQIWLWVVTEYANVQNVCYGFPVCTCMTGNSVTIHVSLHSQFVCMAKACQTFLYLERQFMFLTFFLCFRWKNLRPLATSLSCYGGNTAVQNGEHNSTFRLRCQLQLMGCWKRC